MALWEGEGEKYWKTRAAVSRGRTLRRRASVALLLLMVAALAYWRYSKAATAERQAASLVAQQRLAGMQSRLCTRDCGAGQRAVCNRVCELARSKLPRPTIGNACLAGCNAAYLEACQAGCGLAIESDDAAQRCESMAGQSDSCTNPCSSWKDARPKPAVGASCVAGCSSGKSAACDHALRRYQELHDLAVKELQQLDAQAAHGA
eukprot:PLAT13922.1.p1 GENE.PLAT13922.1~~PLAT13922.1.p1  ORF type:complete len:225 (+),score=46.57 PLAT13922.1:62-676(+)